MAPVYKFSNAGGLTSKQRYTSMLAGNTVWNPWEPQGAYDALSTVTVPSGGVASITFAGIPTGYKHLQIRALHRTSGADATGAFQFWLNNDTGSNYSVHQLIGSGSSASAYGSANQSILLASAAYNTLGAGSTANCFSASIIDILDYSNTDKYKTIRSMTGRESNEAANGRIAFESGSWRNTAPINRIDLKTLSGTGAAANFVQHSSITLYGIR